MPAFMKQPAALCLLWLFGAARAADLPPFAPYAKAKPVPIHVSLYTDDPAHWTETRVTEAMELARRHLNQCRIELSWGAVETIGVAGEVDPEGLWRTEGDHEMVVVLRNPDDPREYRLAGVANLRREPVAGGRWYGEAPWGPLVQALAQTIDAKRLPSWPWPEGPGADGAMTKARLALAWAAAKGWVTVTGMTVAEGHCKTMRHNLSKKLAQRVVYGTRRFGGRPSELLVTDVPNHDAFTFLVRDGKGWRLFDLPYKGEARYPATGKGLALVRLGGATLLLAEAPGGGVEASWLYFDPKQKKRFRPDRVLKDCSGVLAARALRATPGAAVVVCPERVLQLGPLPTGAERDDPLPARARWATLTPLEGGLRLLADGPRAFAVKLGQAPAPVTVDPRERELAKARPEAPIWTRPPAPPIQLGAGALHGLPSGPLALGAGVHSVVDPHRLVVLRVSSNGLRADALYHRASARQALPPGSLWAAHGGSYGPAAWVLVPRDGRWWLRGVDMVREPRSQ